MEILDMEKDKFAKELSSILKYFIFIKKFNVYANVKENAIEVTNLKEKID
jgi:hypothetical protein